MKKINITSVPSTDKGTSSCTSTGAGGLSSFTSSTSISSPIVGATGGASDLTTTIPEDEGEEAILLGDGSTTYRPVNFVATAGIVMPHGRTSIDHGTIELELALDQFAEPSLPGSPGDIFMMEDLDAPSLSSSCYSII